LPAFQGGLPANRFVAAITAPLGCAGWLYPK
jgi:hypothetical protein